MLDLTHKKEEDQLAVCPDEGGRDMVQTGTDWYRPDLTMLYLNDPALHVTDRTM